MEYNLFYLPANDMKNWSPTRKFGVVVLVLMLITFYVLAVKNLLS